MVRYQALVPYMITQVSLSTENRVEMHRLLPHFFTECQFGWPTSRDGSAPFFRDFLHKNKAHTI